MFGFIFCPFCLEMAQVDRKSYRCLSSACNAQLDVRYVNFYSGHPALFLPLIGVSGVGKTVFMQALMLTLRQINRLWSNSCSVAADTATFNYIRKVERMYKAATTPPMTGGGHEVYMMYLQSIPPWRDMTLIFRDLSGENYINLVFPTEVSNFLAKQSIVFMMLSLADVLRGDYTIDELIHSYIHTQMSSGKPSTRKPKRMVVILTQADNVSQIPSNIATYLYSDTVWNNVRNIANKPLDSSTFVHNYLNEMRKVSSSIRSWLSYELAPLTALANHANIELYFCIISSLGSQPQGGKLANPLHPYRILDPLLWALELDSENTRK